jgi:hypothetical protein
VNPKLVAATKAVSVVFVLALLAPQVSLAAKARAKEITAGTPAISGTAALNTKLTADPGTWTSSYPLSFAYQWQRCDGAGANCANIRGATGTDYTPEFYDVRPGQTVRVVVTGSTITDVASAPSTVTAPIPSTSPAALGVPELSGQTIDGGTVSATRGTWRSLEPYSLSFQWQRCEASCVDIEGARGPNYVPGPHDVELRLRVQVTARSWSGQTTTGSVSSATVAAAPPRPAEPVRVFVPLSPTLPLVAIDAPWFGTPPFAISYQWQHCNTSDACTPIVGATAQRYIPSAVDLLAGTVRVQVTATNAAGSATAVSSAITPGTGAADAIVAAQAKPAKYSAMGLRRKLDACHQNPYISGGNPTQNPSPNVHVTGYISIGSSGDWSPPWGSCPNWGLRYAWFRDGGLVVDQGYSTAGYSTTTDDSGHTVQIQVTYEYYVDGGYYGASARSSGTYVYNNGPNAPGSTSPTDGARYVFVPGASNPGPGFSAQYTDPDGDPGYFVWFMQKFNGSSYTTVQASYGLGDVNCSYPNQSEICNGGWGRFFPNPGLEPSCPGLPNHGYAWTMSTEDVWGTWGANSSTYYFEICGTPTVPTLVSPALNVGPPSGQTTIVSTVRPVLKVSSSDAQNDPITYHFQIATDSGFSNIVGDFGSVPSAAFTVPPSWTYSSQSQSLKDGQTYYWRTRASNEYGDDAHWSNTWSFKVSVPKFGTNGVWPLWSGGPLAVNEATGNLVLSVPTPSFPTSAGSLGAAITYNSRDTKNRGLGVGWSIGSSIDPVQLTDHSLATDQTDVVEILYSDGSSDYFQHGGGTSYLPPNGSNAQLS